MVLVILLNKRRHDRWLSSYLFHYASAVLQQASMKLFYLEEKSLEECIHCLLYDIG